MLMHVDSMIFFKDHEVLSEEAKDAAAHIEQRLQLGSKLSEIVRNREDACVLFDLFRDEGYILTEHEGRFCVSNMHDWQFSISWFPIFLNFHHMPFSVLHFLHT